MHATQKLVTSFLKSRPAAANDAFQRFQRTETEVGRTSDFDGLHLVPSVYGSAFGSGHHAEKA